MSNTCQYIISKGANSGLACNAGCRKLYSFPELEIVDMPLCASHKRIIEARAGRKVKNKSDIAMFNSNRVTNLPKQDDNGQIRLEKSIFGFSLNTNRTVDNLSNGERERVKTLVIYLMDNNNILDFIVSNITGDQVDRGNIINVRKDYQFEIGPKRSLLHLHALLEIDHTDNIQLPFRPFKRFVDTYLGFTTYIYHNPQRHTPNSKMWERYINKTNVVDL